MRIALVTGGATGIGAATVAALAKEKITVALQYSSSQTEAKQLADQLKEKGFKVEILQAVAQLDKHQGLLLQSCPPLKLATLHRNQLTQP